MYRGILRDRAPYFLSWLLWNGLMELLGDSTWVKQCHLQVSDLLLFLRVLYGWGYRRLLLNRSFAMSKHLGVYVSLDFLRLLYMGLIRFLKGLLRMGLMKALGS